MRYQSTGLNKNFGRAIDRLEEWASNPWRRYSLLIIVLLLGFFFGTSIGMINGALALMDPIGALISVLLMELMIRLRTKRTSIIRNYFLVNILDFYRIGFLYGLLTEGFKLL